MAAALKGIAASSGLAIAKAFILSKQKKIPQQSDIHDTKAETVRFEKAVEQAKTELEHIKQTTEERMGSEHAEIFEGHLMLLEDPDLMDGVLKKINEEAINAEYALHEVSQAFITMLIDMEDELLRERAVDVKDITDRIMSHLTGEGYTDLSTIKEPCIIIAEDLTPSDTAQLNKELVQGFITEVGSRTSHSAIMARSLEIPAIVGVGTGLRDIPKNPTIVLDGLEGFVIINPCDEELAYYQDKKAKYDAKRQELKKLKDQPSQSKDGHQVEIAANIGSIEDVQKVIDNGADGIGLFRTEFLYMGKSRFPTEDEQYQIYRYVLEKMNGKPVVIRTLDIGGDKELSYMDLPKEQNPFLGIRALRLCLIQEHMFRTQLRALLRASVHGNLKIMFPMISVLEEWIRAKQLLDEEQANLIAENIPVAATFEVGMMIEVPAAAISADAFAKEVDFFSIGTNDLIQYTLAADRMNEAVSYLYQPCHPAILRLTRMVIEAAHAEGKWVGMCGEMAGDELSIPLLLGLGLQEFSMSASSILPARALIAELSQQEWSQQVQTALKMKAQHEVKAFVKNQIRSVLI
jgi:phosphotransferase system enzyme I (PtsI)